MKPDINPNFAATLTNDCNFLHEKNQRLDKLLHERDEQLAALTKRIEEAEAALTPKPLREGVYPWAVELEPTARHAQFWIEGGRKESSKAHAIICVEQGVNSWKNACYAYAEKYFNLKLLYEAKLDSEVRSRKVTLYKLRPQWLQLSVPCRVMECSPAKKL